MTDTPELTPAERAAAALLKLHEAEEEVKASRLPSAIAAQAVLAGEGVDDLLSALQSAIAEDVDDQRREIGQQGAHGSRQILSTLEGAIRLSRDRIAARIATLQPSLPPAQPATPEDIEPAG